jgi:hypothetical protein
MDNREREIDVFMILMVMIVLSFGIYCWTTGDRSIDWRVDYQVGIDTAIGLIAVPWE